MSDNCYTKIHVACTDLPVEAVTFARVLNNAVETWGFLSDRREDTSEIYRLAAEIYTEHQSGTNCIFMGEQLQTSLTIIGEDEARIGPVASILHQMLKKFDITTSIYLQWCYYSDRCDPGSNGGGMAIVTRCSVNYFDADDWYNGMLLTLAEKGEIVLPNA